MKVIGIVKLIPPMSRYIITIKKLNNILMNYFQIPCTRINFALLQINISLNWEIFNQEVQSFSIVETVDKILQAFRFHIFATEYLEKRALYFTDIIDLSEFIAKPVINNLGQIVTNSKEEELKKKNEHLTKKQSSLINIILLCPI